MPEGICMIAYDHRNAEERTPNSVALNPNSWVSGCWLTEIDSRSM
jgi:hypothetical protein